MFVRKSCSKRVSKEAVYSFRPKVGITQLPWGTSNKSVYNLVYFQRVLNKKKLIVENIESEVEEEPDDALGDQVAQMVFFTILTNPFSNY